jgi:hypothetical protein
MKSKDQKELEFLRGMEKLKGAPVKSADYKSPLNQDVMPVKGGQAPVDPVTRIKNATQHIDTNASLPVLSGGNFKSKIAQKLAENKKLMGAIPFAGVAAAALSGDPAMAAEELAQDAMGPAGLAYEAIRPEQAGNIEEEQMMLAERQAMENYKNSPAGQAAKFAKIRSMLGK